MLVLESSLQSEMLLIVCTWWTVVLNYSTNRHTNTYRCLCLLFPVWAGQRHCKWSSQDNCSAWETARLPSPLLLSSVSRKENLPAPKWTWWSAWPHWDGKGVPRLSPSWGCRKYHQQPGSGQCHLQYQLLKELHVEVGHHSGDQRTHCHPFLLLIKVPPKLK